MTRKLYAIALAEDFELQSTEGIHLLSTTATEMMRSSKMSIQDSKLSS